MNQEETAQANLFLRGKKIFIVEDDRFLHRLLINSINKWGAHIFSAFDGKETVEKIREADPDIIILDLILPGMDGFEILDELKKDAELKSVPVVILSNVGQEEDIKKGKELGADDYLIKANFTLDEIVQKINQALTQKK